MKPLAGIVAPITTDSTVPDATTLARQARVAEAAVAYVAALREWNEHVTALRTYPEKTAYTTERRRNLHRARRALVEAVDSQR